jgi:hypothetical protein
MPFRYERFAAIWPPDLTGDPSCRHRRVLAEYRGDSPPTIDPAQRDLPTRHEAEEQDDGGVFAGQRALCLHAPAEFLVEPLDGRKEGTRHLLIDRLHLLIFIFGVERLKLRVAIRSRTSAEQWSFLAIRTRLMRSQGCQMRASVSFISPSAHASRQ